MASSTSKDLYLKECDKLIELNGVPFEWGVKLRKLVVTGPPCSGKSTLINRLGAWPMEGYLNLSTPWWRSPALAYRPREAHLCFPFPGFDRDLSVFDPLWLEKQPSPNPDYARILIPPGKRGFFSIDWRSKLCFDFLIPPPEVTWSLTRERALKGTHHVDQEATLETVTHQTEIYTNIARFFHLQGLKTYVRTAIDAPPKTFYEEPQC